MRRAGNSRAGVTLMEVLIAVTLLSLLVVGMSLAIRVGLAAYTKTTAKLMEDRRVAGAQRILEDELQGLMPVFAACGGAPGSPGTKVPFFQGEPTVMHMVSAFSLQKAWRGQPQMLEFFVLPGDEGGVRLMVNETPYAGLPGTAQFCTGVVNNALARLAQFRSPAAGSGSFVLADKLRSCTFSYQAPATPANPVPAWGGNWAGRGWPLAVRIEMAPLEPDPSRVQPISVTAAIHIRRDPEAKYADAY